MAFKARQFALAQNTATNLLPSSTWTNLTFALQDSLPVSIKNEDASAVVWIGGPDVSNTQGQSLNAGQQIAIAVFSNDVPWAYTTSALSPIVSVLVLRQ
jgi:hypothetical protein